MTKRYFIDIILIIILEYRLCIFEFQQGFQTHIRIRDNQHIQRTQAPTYADALTHLHHASLATYSKHAWTDTCDPPKKQNVPIST